MVFKEISSMKNMLVLNLKGFIDAKQVIIIIICVCVILLLLVFKTLLVNYRKKQKLSELAKQKIRDSELNKAISNKSKNVNIGTGKDIPYEVDYAKTHRGIKKKINITYKWMIQLVEKSELSERRYMLDLDNEIEIGSQRDQNSITVCEPSVARKHCCIFVHQEKVFIKNLDSENKTIITRKKSQTALGENAVEILSGDSIQLGNVQFGITIIKQKI